MTIEQIREELNESILLIRNQSYKKALERIEKVEKEIKNLSENKIVTDKELIDNLKITIKKLDEEDYSWANLSIGYTKSKLKDKIEGK